jgi:hypothetical protein
MRIVISSIDAFGARGSGSKNGISLERVGPSLRVALVAWPGATNENGVGAPAVVTRLMPPPGA